MRTVVALGLLLFVLVMTFGLSGATLADRGFSVEHTTPFASVPDAEADIDDDRTISGERIDGDVEADGDVVVTDESRIRGDVEAGGDVTISDSRIDGDVEADGDVVVTDGSRIRGDVEAEGDVTISDSRVDGDVEADGDVVIEGNSRIQGDVEAEGTVELSDGSSIEGDVDAEDGVIKSKQSEGDGEIDADGDDINEDGQAASELSNLNIADQGAEATITEADDEDVSVTVENVGDASGSFDVTLAIGNTPAVTKQTNELAERETETVTFHDVTTGLVVDGYTIDVSTTNDTVTGTLEIQSDEQESDNDADEQESDNDADEQESDSDADEQESDSDADEQESDSDADEQESDNHAAERENEQASERDEDERAETFEVLTSSLSNTEITAGERLQIELQVENVADGNDTFDADLLVNGETVDSESITIEAGGTETVAFSYQFNDPGEYEIAVGDRLLDSVTVTPANEDESKMERSSDDATGIEIVQATVPADWIREGYKTPVLVTVENTANRTANRTLTVTINDEPVANKTVTLQPHERDEVTVEFEATTGSVAVEDIDAGWIDASETDAEDDSEEETTEEVAGFGFGVGITAFLVIVGILAGVAILKPEMIADST